MAKHYLPVQRDQPFLLPPSVQEFVPEDDLAWFLIDVVAAMDTGEFHARTRLGGVGRAGYDPEMLLTLLIYAYCLGQRSSRRIEALCVRDLGFRVVTGNRVVDHSTIAAFRANHEQAIRKLFSEVLLLCAKAGLRQVGVVAVDGTKIAASAGRGKTREREALRLEQERLSAEVARMLAEAAATDASQDALFGLSNRGDELPAPLRRRLGRLARLEDAIRQIDQARAAHDAEEHGPTPTGRPRRSDKVATAQRQLDQLTQHRDRRLAKEHAAGGPLRGRQPDFDALIAQAEADLAAARAEAAGADPVPRVIVPRRSAKVAAAQHKLDRLKQLRDRRLAKEHAAGRRLPGSRPDFDALIAQAEADLAAAHAETANPDNDTTPATPEPTTTGDEVAVRDTPGTELVPYTATGGEVAVRDTPGTDLVPYGTTSGRGGTAADLALRPGCNVDHLPSAARRGNPTDPDSRVLKTPRGWVQGYNCQVASVRVQHGRRLVLAAQISQNANDVRLGVPMMQAAVANTEHAGLGTIDLFALDAGYWSDDNLTAPGPDRVIAPGKNRTMLAELRTNGYATNEPPPDATPAERMRHRLRTQAGAHSYAQRAPTVEPVFADTKHNRGITTFQRRGKTAANSEWNLIHATGNLLTLHRHTRKLGHRSLHAALTNQTPQQDNETT